MHAERATCRNGAGEKCDHQHEDCDGAQGQNRHADTGTPGGLGRPRHHQQAARHAAERNSESHLSKSPGENPGQNLPAIRPDSGPNPDLVRRATVNAIIEYTPAVESKSATALTTAKARKKNPDATWSASFTWSRLMTS